MIITLTFKSEFQNTLFKTKIKMINLTGYMGNYLCFLFLCVLMVNAIPLRRRVDIIEKRIGVVETHMNTDNEVAREMFLSLQQNFEDINSSMINLKNQNCLIMGQREVKEDQSDLEKNVEILQSSRVMMILGLKREKQWTRDQVKRLSAKMGEHTDWLDRQFLNLTNQIHLHTDELTNNYSKLRTEIIDNTENEKQGTRDQVTTIESDVYIEINKTGMVISSQQKEIEALKETQTNLLNALISANVIKYDYKCPEDWKKHSSYCYLIVKDNMRFNEARTYCKLLGATLADIENQAENTFIADHFKHVIHSYAWSGYSDDEKEGTWISERTGHPASFTNFADGQPDGGIHQNCAVLYFYNGKWLDLKCDHKWHVVCKKDATIEFKL